MADRRKNDTSRPVKNTLLTAANYGFPYENFPSTTLLVPATLENSPAILEDVGEVDSFVGQTPPPTSTLPPFSITSQQRHPSASSVPLTGISSRPSVTSVLPPLSTTIVQNKHTVTSSNLQTHSSHTHTGLISSDVKPISFFSSQPSTFSDPFSQPSILPPFQTSVSQQPPVSVSQSAVSESFTPLNNVSNSVPSVPLLSTTQIGVKPLAPPIVESNSSYPRTSPEIPSLISSDSYLNSSSPVPYVPPQPEQQPYPQAPPHATPPPSRATPTPPHVTSPLSLVTLSTPVVAQHNQQSSLLTTAPVPLTAGPPAGPTGTNTYRLGSQRKLQYAHPPGLSVSSSPSVYSPAPAGVPAPASVSTPVPLPPNPHPLPSENPSFPLPSVNPPLHPSSVNTSYSSPALPASPFVPTPLEVNPPLPLPSVNPPLHPSSVNTSYSSPALPASPFVPTPLEEIKRYTDLTTLSATVSTPSFHNTAPSNYSPLQSLNSNLGASFSSPVIPPSSHNTSSVASYFPSPIVAAANAMAATVAAANGGPQFPNSATTDSAVIPASFNNLAIGQPTYRPVYHHWFLKKEIESKVLWQPFTMTDSLALEEAFTSTDISPETVVATDGGRYDVNILRRQRIAVYWDEIPTEVRRCSWFYKGSIDSRYVPYEENVATKLEEEFKIAMAKNEWHRRVELPHGETVVFHGPNVMVHFPQASSPDAWGNTPQVPTRPRVVKRGVDEFDIEEGEPPKVDHLLFLVHGVGSACDLKFRTVEEVVDDFRSLSYQLVQSHFRTSVEQGKANRIEVLPVSWHSTLHSEDTGIDQKLKSITLQSIPKLRHFTNDTLLDILFYTSPVYCQTIIHTVGKEINRLYELFRSRHPDFQGGVSLGGHSLGSLILFDLLCHQKDPQTPTIEKEQKLQSIPSEDAGDPLTSEEQSQMDSLTTQKVPPKLRRLSHRVSYVMGNAGTGQPFITYPQLNFHPKAFFAMGSPIGMFVTVRGIDALGEEFRLPTCPGFFNIFHPFDPVAYRIETLINPELSNLKPVMVPHHKGRKRMHLELKETMARVGADLKQKFLDSVRSTWNTVYQLAMFHRTDAQALEHEVDKVIEEQLRQEETESAHSEEADTDVTVGMLNSGRRVDYVLQEAPLESFNEYLFALGSHVCYWESEDTMLMILKEVYSALGISADRNVPHANTIYERRHSVSSHSPDLPSYQESLFATPSSSMSHFVGENSDTKLNAQTPDLDSDAGSNQTPSTPSLPQSFESSNPSTPGAVGMDPTAPPSENKNIGPPPMSGFVRK